MRLGMFEASWVKLAPARVGYIEERRSQEPGPSRNISVIITGHI